MITAISAAREMRKLKMLKILAGTESSSRWARIAARGALIPPTSTINVLALLKEVVGIDIVERSGLSYGRC